MTEPVRIDGLRGAADGILLWAESDTPNPDLAHARREVGKALHGLLDHVEGFTWEDVDAIRFVLDRADLVDEGPYGEGWQSDEMAASEARLGNLADRIVSLLPPRTPPEQRSTEPERRAP